MGLTPAGQEGSRKEIILPNQGGKARTLSCWIVTLQPRLRTGHRMAVLLQEGDRNQIVTLRIWFLLPLCSRVVEVIWTSPLAGTSYIPYCIPCSCADWHFGAGWSQDHAKSHLELPIRTGGKRRASPQQLLPLQTDGVVFCTKQSIHQYKGAFMPHQA